MYHKKLKIGDRDYPRNGIFKKNYRENPYKILEDQIEFDYYEKTPINEIVFDDRHSISWYAFSQEGLNYLLPVILDQVQDNLYGISSSLEDFIIKMTLNENIRNLILSLNKNELLVVKSILENILFGNNVRLIKSIGEYYLFSDLEFLENLINEN